VTLVPLSFGQERLHFFDRLQPGSTLYAVPYRLEIEGKLDTAALEHAFAGLIERHAALRTRFVEHDGGYYQSVSPSISFQLPCEDISDVADQGSLVDALTSAFAAAPIDLAAGPLVCAHLYRSGPDRHVLLLKLHHIVFDGWSYAVLVNDLDALYRAARRGRRPPLPTLPIQYTDFALWQRQRHAGGHFADDLAYWKDALAGAPPVVTLPIDRPRPAAPTHTGCNLDAELPAALVDGVLALARSFAVTPFLVLTGAVNALLMRYGGQADVCVGLPVTGRSHPEHDLDGLIGFFANTVVLRTRCAYDATFRQIVEATRQAMLGALEHDAMPFDKLVEALAPERSLAYHPLFQVCVTYQTTEDFWRMGDLKVYERLRPSTIAKFDLTFDFSRTPRGIRMRIEYSDELFHEGTVRGMMRELLSTLERGVSNPDARAADGSPSSIAASPVRGLRKRR